MRLYEEERQNRKESFVNIFQTIPALGFCLEKNNHKAQSTSESKKKLHIFSYEQHDSLITTSELALQNALHGLTLIHLLHGDKLSE